MEKFKIIKVKQSVLANNDRNAAEFRAELKGKGIFLINLMSSPGSGKTTLLTRLIPMLEAKGMKIGVMEADIDAFVDAETIQKETGVRTVQVNTSGECHLDAKMTSEGLQALGGEGLDIVILENIGNLVCPAEFDTGAALNLVLLSVPEGDDKPLKYPLMFQVGNAFVFTKMDVQPVFDFDLEKAKAGILRRNPNAVFFPVSAKKGEGLEPLVEYLVKRVEEYKAA